MKTKFLLSCLLIAIVAAVAGWFAAVKWSKHKPNLYDQRKSCRCINRRICNEKN